MYTQANVYCSTILLLDSLAASAIPHFRLLCITKS